MEHQNLRAFIPSGNCVPPVAVEAPYNVYETFQAIDDGAADETLLAIARQACLNCVQKAWCEEQFDPITNELWRAGVKLPMVAGEQRKPHGPRSVLPDLSNVALRFNLSEVPKEPPMQALEFLRQGVRAKQLFIAARPPFGVPIIAQEYRKLLGERQPEVLEAVDTQFTEDERDKAFRYIILVLCQQADFENFSRATRTRKDGQRYRPDLHNFEISYPILRCYLKETIAIKQMGYKNPGQMAMHYNVQYCQELLNHFSQDITPISYFFSIVQNNVNDPSNALRAFLARVQAQRAHGEASPTNIKRRALTNRPPASSPVEHQKRETLLTDHPDATPAFVDKTLTTHENPADRLRIIEERKDDLARIYGEDHPFVTPSIIKKFAQRAGYKVEVEKYIVRRKELESIYGQDADFTPYLREWFAESYKDSADRAETYKDRLKLWRGWAKAETDAKVPDSYLRACARMGGFESFEDILKAHKVRTLQERFKARDQRYERTETMGIWLLNHIANLYPWQEIEQVGESIYTLRCAGVLTAGIAELKALHDPLFIFDAHDIAEPHTKFYLTFAEGLQKLSSEARLRIACDYDLLPLLYGKQFSQEQTESLLTERNWETTAGDILKSFDTSVINEQAIRPLPVDSLNQDVLCLLQTSGPATRETEMPTQTPHDIVTIVGAGLVQIHYAELTGHYFESALSTDQKEWLQHKINASYSPAERRRKMRDIENALQGERVIIRGKTPETYHITLADTFYGEGLTDVDRALIAHMSGVDNLLYGQDMSLTLKYRLGTADLLEHFVTHLLPRIDA